MFEVTNPGTASIHIRIPGIFGSLSPLCTSMIRNCNTMPLISSLDDIHFLPIIYLRYFSRCLWRRSLQAQWLARRRSHGSKSAGLRSVSDHGATCWPHAQVSCQCIYFYRISVSKYSKQSSWIEVLGSFHFSLIHFIVGDGIKRLTSHAIEHDI